MRIIEGPFLADIDDGLAVVEIAQLQTIARDAENLSHTDSIMSDLLGPRHGPIAAGVEQLPAAGAQHVGIGSPDLLPRLARGGDHGVLSRAAPLGAIAPRVITEQIPERLVHSLLL